MAAIEQSATQGEQPPVSSDDIELVTRLGIKILREGEGLKVIQDALTQSQDPGQVVGQFLTQMITQLAEQVSKQYGLDVRAFLAEGGFLENILDWMEDQLDLPEDFSDQVYNEVLEMMKAVAANPPPEGGGMQGQAPQQGQPPMDEQAAAMAAQQQQQAPPQQGSPF